MSNYDKYKNEIKEKYGNTDAYKEYVHKTKDNTKDKWNNLIELMDEIISKFAVCMNEKLSPEAPIVQNLVKSLQTHISRNYYNCTKEILYGLGQMYVLDERFKNNIDKYGNGTALYISNAIEIYCRY